MNMTITRLSKHDVAKIRQLNELFATVFEDTESYKNHAPDDVYLMNFLADKNNIVIVGEHNSRIIGGLVAYCLTKFERQRTEVYLYDLAVDTTFQRQGVGKKLVEELRRVAKSLGAYIVFVQADEGDSDAVAFYQSLGPTDDIKTRNFDFDVVG